MLSNNYSCTEISDKSLKALGTILKDFPLLTIFNLSLAQNVHNNPRNRSAITNKGIEDLSQGLKENKLVTSFYLNLAK